MEGVRWDTGPGADTPFSVPDPALDLEYSGANLVLKVFSPGNKPESQIQIIVVTIVPC